MLRLGVGVYVARLTISARCPLRLSGLLLHGLSLGRVLATAYVGGATSSPLMRPLLLALVIALAPAAVAQDSTFVAPDTQTSAVVFSLRATVPTGDAPVPEVVVALSNDAHLARLDLSRSSQVPREEFRAEFVFQSVADYLAWRRSDRVAALLTELEAGSPGSGVAMALSLRRYPLVNWLPDEG